MITLKNISPLQILSLLCLCCCFTTLWLVEAEEAWGSNLVVKKDDRRKVLEAEFGEISAVEIGDGDRFPGSFNLQFFILEPNALFLPVMLHSEMLLYCHSGSGDLTWMGPGKKSTTLSLSRGDVNMLRQGSVFFIRSNLGTDQRERLRITALFANSNEDLHFRFSSMGPYSSIADLVRGFDSSVLQAAFQVPEEVIQTIKSAAKQPLIIQDVLSQPEEGQSWDWEGRFMRVFLSLEVAKMENKKKKKHKESRTFNVYTADRDFENCNGWSLTVTSKDLEVLKDSDFGAFYVNLTKGAMMAPHWNPMASEIAFVVAGQGMVRIVCSSSDWKQSGCENQSFKVEEGDVFMVPRFHPMSQTSFNNDSFVFMGFSTAGKRNYPQYLVGKQSVFQVIDKDVLAAAFNVDNETVVQLSGPQEEALIVECTSCAEEQFSAWQEEVERSRQEEERKKREEEEARKREEEEEAKRKEEEEEEARERDRKRQEEEAAREEEEERTQREEEARERDRKRQEEAAAREEEEERRQREEEARERERKRQEEAAARKEEERRQEEAAARKEEERRQEEEAAREEEEKRQREEQAQREEEERRQSQEEERAEQERRQREEEARRQKEEEGRGGGGESEEEAARRQEEERERREREEQHDGGGGGGGEEPEEEVPARTPEERQPRKPARRERRQPQEEAKGGQGESEGEAAMRQEEERIRSEREQMERRRSVEPPIILVDNLDKVMDLLF